MTDLLIIGDDFTGTLDAAAPFAAVEVAVIPTPDAIALSAELARGTRVIAVNANTRHLDAEKAAAVVFGLVSCACQADVRIVLKKTDSVLRGNVGAELAAARDALGAEVMHFAPAFPEAGRTTVGGMQYVDGVPVAESPLGHDPFEPVTCSRPADVVALQTDVPTICVPAGEACPEGFGGIAIYDADDDETMDAIASGLLAGEKSVCLAGCAGVAAGVAHALGIGAAPRAASSAACEGGLLVMCGSVNPVSVGQCAHARAAGAPSFLLEEGQKLDLAWLDAPEGQAFLADVRASWDREPLTVIDGSVMADASGISVEEARSLVATNLGALMARVCEGRTHAKVLVMGGDVLLSFLTALGARSVRLRGEVITGIVAFEVRLDGMTLDVISKSGGFGEEDLFVRLAHMPHAGEGNQNHA